MSNNPKSLPIIDEVRLTKVFDERSVTGMRKLSSNSILFYTKAGYIRVFDIHLNAVVAEARYRENMLIRDCHVTYGSTMDIYCLMAKGVVDETYHATYQPVELEERSVISRFSELVTLTPINIIVYGIMLLFK